MACGVANWPQPPLSLSLPHALAGSEALVVRTMLCVFPNPVGRHDEATGEWSTPFGRGGGFAPIIGDVSRLNVVEFGDADVSVQASVAVVAGPFDDDGVLEVKSPTDGLGERGKGSFDFSD